MNYNADDFPKLLDKYLKTAGLTDETLAEQISLTKMTVYNWRTCKIKRPSSCDKLLKCAKIFKLTPKQQANFLQAAGHLSENDEPPLPPIPVVGLPIIRPYQFFGRETLLSNIYWAWHKTVPESIAIVGPKRSGKTSLLNYLNNIAQATHLRPEQPQGWPKDWLPHHFQFALVDFQEANMHKPETLVSDVLRQLKLEVPKPCDLAGFSSTVKQQINQPTVILMDEIEVGLRVAALDTAFWWNLRSLASQGKLSFVMTAAERPNQLARDFDKLSPFFSLFGHTLCLEALTENEARELLDNSPKPFAPKDTDWMLKESGCWPEPLQKLCDARLQQLLLGQTGNG